jgi:hypothetical protein
LAESLNGCIFEENYQEGTERTVQHKIRSLGGASARGHSIIIERRTHQQGPCRYRSQNDRIHRIEEKCPVIKKSMLQGTRRYWQCLMVIYFMKLAITSCILEPAALIYGEFCDLHVGMI